MNMNRYGIEISEQSSVIDSKDQNEINIFRPNCTGVKNTGDYLEVEPPHAFPSVAEFRLRSDELADLRNIRDTSEQGHCFESFPRRSPVTGTCCPMSRKRSQLCADAECTRRPDMYSGTYVLYTRVSEGRLFCFLQQSHMRRAALIEGNRPFLSGRDDRNPV